MSTNDKRKKTTAKKTAEGLPPEPTGDDTAGHNLFALSDYYVQSKMGRQADRDREAHLRALIKEARNKNKPERR